MKFLIATFLLLPHICNATHQQKINDIDVSGYKFFKVNSHIEGLSFGLHQYKSTRNHTQGTILLVHGSSFPSKLSFAFKMKGKSMIDVLTEKGFNVYSLDFLGYGDAERYPQMIHKNNSAAPLGRGLQAANDLNISVDFILANENIKQIDLLGHSWGGAVAARFAGQNPHKVNKLIMYAAITPVSSNQVTQAHKVPAYSLMSPKERIKSLNSLAPEPYRPLLAPEMFKTWGTQWLKSDPIKKTDLKVSFPAGPKSDVQDFLNGKSFYDPALITSNVLLVRGEHDKYPSKTHSKQLLKELVNVPIKQYIEIENGTHVMHLEKNRHALYQVIINFLIDPGL